VDKHPEECEDYVPRIKNSNGGRVAYLTKLIEEATQLAETA